ncbi:hypothetical protein JL722_14108 [Aureococcus anophagefferens]|nr:hypothetical protein JL722_14108 [Aureococcus anophagefferens]
MRPMDVKQREITPQPGVRAHRACAFFGAVSLLLSLSTWSEIGSLGPFIEAAPVALVAYRSDLGEAGAVDHPVGVVAEPHRPTTLRLSSGDAAYVRRELRALTSKDRAAFLESMHVVWALETSAGKKSYGDDYRGLDYFAEKHLRGSAALVCDHWHDGAGIMNHHAAFSLEFEKSLQAARGRVREARRTLAAPRPIVGQRETALHYWDYVEDARHGGAFRRSEIFDDDWFGALPPSNSSAKAIPRGPWAYARLPTGSRYGNAHGLARAPWNVDGAPFVTFRPDARYSRERLNESGALDYVATLANVSALNATDELWARLHAAFCAIGTVGEMYTSASPTDPTFWVVHPNLERLLMRKRLYLDGFDETWGYARNARTASDTGLVCDWSAVDREHDADCAPAVCPGHGADDALPFRGLFGDNATVSNAAFYAATHPLDAALPYAYDALHWAACGAASPLALGNGRTRRWELVEGQVCA